MLYTLLCTQCQWAEPADNTSPNIRPGEQPVIEGSQHVYLPLIGGGNGIVNIIAAEAPKNITADERKADKPQFKEGGVKLHKGWRIQAKKLGQKLEKLDRAATLIFSAQKLIKQGIDPRTLQLWTRPDDAVEDDPWNTVNRYYDEPNQLFIVVTTHFSDWGLGDGMQSSGQSLPLIRSFANDLYSGAASVNIPIEAPSGLGGMSPGLSLSYSSLIADDVTNGLSKTYDRGVQASWAGGYGWNLSDISSIQRSPFGCFMVLNDMAVNLIRIGDNSYKTDPEMFLKITHAGGGLSGGDCPGFTHYCDIEPWTV